jgi:hypothetical protein
VEARPTTAKRVKSDNGLLWRLVTDHPDIFDTHVVPKLNGNDMKFFYDVNTESRGAVKRSNVRLADAFKIGDFDTKSTISWALEKCLKRRERFCERMALNGNLELLQVLRGKGCPWNEWTCSDAAENGHLECLKYAHENGCPWNKHTCFEAAKNGHLECLKYAHENRCPWDYRTCFEAAVRGHLESRKGVFEYVAIDHPTLFFSARRSSVRHASTASIASVLPEHSESSSTSSKVVVPSSVGSISSSNKRASQSSSSCPTCTIFASCRLCRSPPPLRRISILPDVTEKYCLPPKPPSFATALSKVLFPLPLSPTSATRAGATRRALAFSSNRAEPTERDTSRSSSRAGDEGDFDGMMMLSMSMTIGGGGQKDDLRHHSAPPSPSPPPRLLGAFFGCRRLHFFL